MSLVLVPHPDDRRRRPRVPVEMTVEALDRGPRLLAHDIGIGGMLVTTDRPRWPGQHLRVRFRLPGAARPTRATCRVLELVEVPRGIGLSLQFLQLAPRAEVDILRFVGERLQAQREAPAATVLAPPG